MRHLGWPLLGLLALLGGAGCNLLFPELSGSGSPDLLPTDLLGDLPSSALTLRGVVCSPSDLRMLHSCAQVSGHGLHVTIEETRDSATVDATGHFVVTLSQPLTVATLAASATDGTYLPTVASVPVSPTALAIPVYAQTTLSSALLNVGQTFDDTRGLVIAYVVNSSGVSLSGVRASAAPGGAAAILYDGRAVNQLDSTSATGADGTVLVVNQAASSMTLSLTPQAGSTVGANQFVLPTRPGAVTFAVTILPPT